MDKTRFLERKTDFLKAVLRLQEACDQPHNAFMRDSVIQRFEFCWELTWKVMKIWLTYLGIEALNPRDIFREALQAGLIEDGNAWSTLQKMRNLTSHTYDELLAEQVYTYVRQESLALFAALSEKVKTWQLPAD